MKCFKDKWSHLSPYNTNTSQMWKGREEIFIKFRGVETDLGVLVCECL